MNNFFLHLGREKGERERQSFAKILLRKVVTVNDFISKIRH